MTDTQQGFFSSGPIGGLGRPLAVATLWAFAGALAGGLIAGLASLIAGAVAGAIWLFDRSVSVTGAMGETVRVAAWVLAPVGIAVSVWAAAYGSTRRASIPRTLVAAPAAIILAVALLSLGSSGLLASALALGWALAIPAESPTRIAVRAVPLLLAALFVPRLADLSPWTLVAFLAASPVVAAVAVFAADLPWSRRRRSATDA